jgi:hypothetical protein
VRTIVYLGILLASTAINGASLASAADAFNSAAAVSADTLDGYRGGFPFPSGLAVSFGIERIVSIGGEVAERSALQLGDLGRLTSGQATLSALSPGQLNLIQNGAAGLAIQPGSALGATVIQNSLNNQLINNATIINASVNAQGMLQAMQFQSTLSNALNSAATAR